MIRRWVHRHEVDEHMDKINAELIAEYLRDNRWYVGSGDLSDNSYIPAEYPTYDKLVRWIETRRKP
jgi:hypothetical protein